MAKGRAVAIVLEAEEKSELAALTRKHGAPQALAERARIVLAAASGLNNKEIAAKVGVCAVTVGTWRNRFAERSYGAGGGVVAPSSLDQPMEVPRGASERSKPFYRCFRAVEHADCGD
jgi:hypothetical protein